MRRERRERRKRRETRERREMRKRRKRRERSERRERRQMGPWRERRETIHMVTQSCSHDLKLSHSHTVTHS